MSRSFGTCAPRLWASIIGVALQAVAVVVALHVHDGVDADRVRVEARAGADDHDLAPDLGADEPSHPRSSSQSFSRCASSTWTSSKSMPRSVLA